MFFEVHVYFYFMGYDFSTISYFIYIFYTILCLYTILCRIMTRLRFKLQHNYFSHSITCCGESYGQEQLSYMANT